MVGQQIAEANQAFWDLTGYKAEELIGNPVRTIPTAQKAFETVRDGILQGGPASLETKWQRKDGRVIDVLLHASPIVPADPDLGLTFVALDITDRIKSEDTLRHSVQQLEESRRIARLGVYELDVDTGKWTTSAILDEVFGIETDSVHKSNVSGWLELVHPDDRDHMRHYFENEVLCHHASFDMQYRIIRPCDQQIRWVHGLGELAFNHQGEVVRMAGTIGCQPCNTRELPI